MYFVMWQETYTEVNVVVCYVLCVVCELLCLDIAGAGNVCKCCLHARTQTLKVNVVACDFYVLTHTRVTYVVACVFYVLTHTR